MALLAIVPFLGAFVIWGSAAVLLALSGDYTSVVGLAIWGTLVVGIVDNVVNSILVGNTLRMHTMLSFIAVVGGLILPRSAGCGARSTAARGHLDADPNLARSAIDRVEAPP